MNKLMSDFKTIVLNETPLIDVRAPIEFLKGAFKNAVNLPIMDDEERHKIGITYKEEGNQEAVKLGHLLVSGKNKETKIKEWKQFITLHPDALLYCFRGGQRSAISQEWIETATQQPIARLEGGYKAFRGYLMNSLHPESQTYTPIRLGGHTGSGKTILLNQLEHSIDLESIANHRGSSFGNFIKPQPNQINFENNLAYDLIQKSEQGFKHLIFEDEGRHIGRCFLPTLFSEFMNAGSMVVVKVPFDERGCNIQDEYVTSSQQEYVLTYGEEAGLTLWLDYITTSIDKAKKRLGGVRHLELITAVKNAYDHQLATGSIDSHLDWIHLFLKDYYDPMYSYQLTQNKNHIIYEGNRHEVLDYLKHIAKNPLP